MILITIMDRNYWESRTDVMIYIDVENKKIISIPRDLFSTLINDRINSAYMHGGKDLLLNCIKEYGFEAKYNICLLPLAIDQYIKDIKEINVPVHIKQVYKYPLHRHKPIESGSRLVIFNTPFEKLKNNRFHEWFGARYCIEPKKYEGDLYRCQRQFIFVKELLKKKYNFNIPLNLKNIRGLEKDVIEIMDKIDDSWTLNIMEWCNFKHERINNMAVLVLKDRNIKYTKV